MLGVAETAGYLHVADPAEADVIVVNTCGFIDRAKQESIDTILELSEHKHSGRCEKLVVTGCLSQKYPTELAEGMPEVDHFLGSSDMLKLGPVLRGSAQRMLVGNPAEWVIGAADPRRISTRGRSAYVKLGEGCNRNCSFCVIPQLRGKQRSRQIDDIVREVEGLAAQGIVEVNLVSQDTVAYGRDLQDKDTTLAAAVAKIADVPGIRWVRLFYLYPEKLTDSIVSLIAERPNVVPYVDMPLQHVSNDVLTAMRRGHGGDRIRRLVERVRKQIEGVTFRTAFIVGHPGETDAHFEELCEFVRWAQFDRVGVFHYSDEPTSHSFTLEGKVAPAVIAERAEQLMSIQRDISLRKNKDLIGETLEVLVEGASEESDLVMIGRHRGQAPDIDGCVYLSGGLVLPGQLRKARIVESTDYDLLAEVDDADDHDSSTDPGVQNPALKGTLVNRESDGRRVGLRVVS
jgi:ribosomal protein S12 methylthiotransferase